MDDSLMVEHVMGIICAMKPEVRDLFEKAYQTVYGSMKNPTENKKGVGSTHSETYLKMIQNLDKDFFSVEDLHGIIEHPLQDTLLSSRVRKAERINYLLLDASELHLNASRLGMIASVAVVAYYRNQIRIFLEQKIHLNVAKKRAKEVTQKNIPAFQDHQEGYMKKKFQVLEHLYDLCLQGKNMDLLLSKAVTMKQVRSLNAVDRKAFKEATCLGSERWNAMPSYIRDLF